ncbi:CidA/LrgA family protein [Liquorilactobacillus oeni]|uniref:Effector of murein hydrolase LrgA n=1 Tax=Liquorilactobacillus oeni DSM 19972 TaxID=1423777 RepID=A0A0R1MCI2_9LACO|nr:CidA/LrgA family protein [Liquorilactobacillus oeni]KRL05879.1 effector of murein hydrolase LrgA [Liquorilactobacillus oeni DSM 19972]
MNENKQNKKSAAKKAPLLVQMGIYASLLFISNLASGLFPKSFPVPAPVIGMVLLYALLSLHIIKIEWVDSLGAFFISIIGFLFVPSGISLAANLEVMRSAGLQLILVIILSTIILLVVTAYTTRLFIWMKKIHVEKHKLTQRPLILKSQIHVKGED